MLPVRGADIIIAAKLVCLVIWLGAATSKLNKHFPFVISTMMSNNPVFRPRWIKRRFFEHFPDDLRPGRLSRLLAHFTTAIEGLVPLVLFFSHGGWVDRDRGNRDADASTSASCRRSRWGCRWSGTSS